MESYNTNPAPRRVYTIIEAAAELRVSRRTIERRIADGSLPCSHKFGVPHIRASAIAEAAGELQKRPTYNSAKQRWRGRRRERDRKKGE